MTDSERYPLPSEQINLVDQPMLSQEHIQAVARQVESTDAHSGPVREIEHFYLCPVEMYLVTFNNGYKAVYGRDHHGNIRRSAAWSYYASDNFQDTHTKGDNETPQNPIS